MAAAGKNILMYPILEKRLLAEGIWLMQVLAPRVAHSAQPGQFVIVRVDEHGERIPLTISDYDPAQGSVTIVTQAIGASTRKICSLDAGDAFADHDGGAGIILRDAVFIMLDLLFDELGDLFGFQLHCITSFQ